ncbi:hypothetical protein [Coxiella-like endosymbiont of Rhipicephalus sanguineus]|nr:hypothetical protein [Coxiella-like endosymbiont of Rhipicephalus sanguineus]
MVIPSITFTLLIAVPYKLRIHQMLGIIVDLGDCMVETTKACLQTDTN